MVHIRTIHFALASSLLLPAVACDPGDDESFEIEERKKNKPPKYNRDGYNLHLESTVRFNPTQDGADADNGRGLFGVAPDLVTEDKTDALFEGISMAAGGKLIESNNRTCFTCHRGLDDGFGLPEPPLTDHIPLTDELFTAIDADAGGDPDAFFNLDELGLIKYRVNRFDPRVDPDFPFRQVFGWRKSPKLLNIGLQQGFLTDLRGRVMFEAARGAVFSHTQSGDDRFDDLFPVEDGNDMEAFMFGLFSDPQLAALRDAEDPMHDVLVEDPFYTVPVETKAQQKGRKIFEKKCFGCHNTPNVFSNLDNIEPLANGERPPNFPSWAPAVSRAFNVGVSERNEHNLRFTKYVGPGQYEPIVLELANEDGSVNEHEVQFDIGLAMTTGRTVDIGRFKVPQLRNLAANAPYFHDNSAATIEEVVDYFNSDAYNDSADGQDYPIHLNANQRANLIEFLKIL